MIAILNTANELENKELATYASQKRLKIAWVNDTEELEDEALYHAMTDEPSEYIPVEDFKKILRAKIDASKNK